LASGLLAFPAWSDEESYTRAKEESDLSPYNPSLILKVGSFLDRSQIWVLRRALDLAHGSDLRDEAQGHFNIMAET
jgi:hypothetical protein